MPYFSFKERFKIALGGFAFFAGLLLVILAFLTTTRAANIESIIPNEVMIAAAVAVGVLDVVCGFLLLQKK